MIRFHSNWSVVLGILISSLLMIFLLFALGILSFVKTQFQMVGIFDSVRQIRGFSNCTFWFAPEITRNSSKIPGINNRKVSVMPRRNSIKKIVILIWIVVLLFYYVNGVPYNSSYIKRAWINKIWITWLFKN